MCHPPGVCPGHDNASTVRTRTLDTHQPVTVRSQAVPGQDLAPGPAASKQERKMPTVPSLLVFKCARACWFSYGSCQGQDLH